MEAGQRDEGGVAGAGAPGPRLVGCDAFGADGRLGTSVLAWPVAGRRLGPRHAASATLGDSLQPEPGRAATLLVFLRHFG